MERTIVGGDIVRHFKGTKYLVINTNVINSISGEIMVLYCDTGGNGQLWVRERNEFMSEVDREKYPDVKQKYRFEKVVRDIS